MTTFKDIFNKFKNSSIIEQLIVLNTLFFLFSIVFKFFALNWLALSSNLDFFILKPWSLVTYAIVHIDFFHLLSNVLVLYFIGNLFLTFFNKHQLITVYIGGLISAAIVFLIVSYINSSNFLLIGASGAVSAIFIAIATKIPHYSIKLLLFGFVKLWVLTAIWIGISLFQLATHNYGGALAHIGGALFGFFYIYFNFNKFQLFSFKQKSSRQFKKVYKSSGQMKKNQLNGDERQATINKILDKISKSGYDSLSKEEREFLFKQGK
ncbi:MAG: rhomboid family intramembrane serine protease [Bacteroidetes bacterium]|nr:rhomboid family intramembrane serine protease [Bacteroidota bacterium]